MNKEVYSALIRMQDIWVDTLGLTRKYYDVYFAKLVLSIITYKRICDLCREEIKEKFDIAIDEMEEEYCEISNMMSFCYRKKWRWNYVKESDHILEAIEEAICSINRANYCNIAYGDKLIPDFYSPDRGFSEALEGIVEKWMIVLDDVILDEKHICNEEWLEISKYIRKRVKR